MDQKEYAYALGSSYVYWGNTGVKYMLLTIANIIESVVDSMLPRFTSHICLSMVLDISASDFDVSKSNRKFIRFIFYRKMNYTKVFSMISDRIIKTWEFFGEHQYKLECDHDSCWRDSLSSVIHKTQMEMADDLKERGSEKAPIDLLWQIRFSISGEPTYYWFHSCKPVDPKGDVYKTLWNVVLGTKVELTSQTFLAAFRRLPFYSIDIEGAPRVCEECFLDIHGHDDSDPDHSGCKNVSESGHQCQCSGIHWPELLMAIKAKKGKRE